MMRDDNESDVSTDSEDEYDISDLDIKSDLLSADELSDLYKSQRGMCRLTGLPFSSDVTSLYAPKIVKRLNNKELSANNCMIVISAVEKMQSSVNMPWKMFIRVSSLVGDCEL